MTLHHFPGFEPPPCEAPADPLRLTTRATADSPVELARALRLLADEVQAGSRFGRYTGPGFEVQFSVEAQQ